MKVIFDALKLLIAVAILGGGAYAGWYYLVRDKVDATPEQKECATEKQAVQNAIDAAVADRQANGLEVVDPGTYLHAEETHAYYTWTATAFGWVLQPIGTPPC